MAVHYYVRAAIPCEFLANLSYFNHVFFLVTEEGDVYRWDNHGGEDDLGKWYSYADFHSEYCSVASPQGVPAVARMKARRQGLL